MEMQPEVVFKLSLKRERIELPRERPSKNRN